MTVNARTMERIFAILAPFLRCMPIVTERWRAFQPRMKRGTRIDGSAPARARSRDQDNPMPEKIGQYTVISQIGRGGMGVVYKARDESLNRFVAIKVLNEQLTEDSTFLQRFVRE